MFGNEPKKSVITKRPKARLKIGNSYRGQKTSFIAQGVVVFREWDPVDKQFYYWEEWELTGFEDYDSWVEYDHYTKKVSMYEPIDIVEQINARDLTVGQTINITVNRQICAATVKEVGVGKVEYLKGKMTYQLFKDDIITYAVIQTPFGEVSVEDYKINNNNEKDYYLAKSLSKAQQKKLFGKTVAPANWIMPAIYIAFFGLLFIPSLIPSYETVCTPRTSTSSSLQPLSANGSPVPVTGQSQVSGSQNQTTNNQQNCVKRRVYGGGGSGVGK